MSFKAQTTLSTTLAMEIILSTINQIMVWFIKDLAILSEIPTPQFKDYANSIKHAPEQFPTIK